MKTQLGFYKNLQKQNIYKGEFGIEKEGLRIDCEGHLSHTIHPMEEQRNITRDFCENQIELITDVFYNAEDALQHLEQLQTKVVEKLQQQKTGRELLWPFSNPPYVKGEEDIPIAQFQGKQQEKTEYRKYLAQKYGKRKMLFSGIHLNYSFSNEMLQEGYQQSDFYKKEDFQSYKNRVYLQLAQKLTKYSWFIVYLTAASPILDASFLKCGSKQERKVWTAEDLTQYASVRCGELGYWNDFVPVFDYQTLDTYVSSIEEYVRSGRLQSVSELYYPVRLKPCGENTLNRLKECGINHIELRMLDVNPLSPIGLCKEDVEFFHYFQLYLICQETIELLAEDQIYAVENEKQAAIFDDTGIGIREFNGEYKPIRESALKILRDMEWFYIELEKMDVLETIRYQKDKLLIPDNRYADRIRREYGTDYVKQGIALAEQYAKALLDK